MNWFSPQRVWRQTVSWHSKAWPSHGKAWRQQVNLQITCWAEAVVVALIGSLRRVDAQQRAANMLRGERRCTEVCCCVVEQRWLAIWCSCGCCCWIPCAMWQYAYGRNCGQREPKISANGEVSKILRSELLGTVELCLLYEMDTVLCAHTDNNRGRLLRRKAYDKPLRV